MKDHTDKHIIIEDEGAYHFCRKGKYANDKVIWHVTSPWLLAKLPMLNEEVFSLEQNISIEQHLRLGHSSIHFGELLANKLDQLLTPMTSEFKIGRALIHRIQVSCFTLLYKAMLITEWYKQYKGKDNLVVVGNRQLQPVTNFDNITGRLDNLFSSIVDSSKVSMVEIVHYIQKDGQDILDTISRKNNMPDHEKLLYILNNMSLSTIMKKSLIRLFNYKDSLDNNIFSKLKNNYRNYKHNIVYIKKCLLLDESISYLKRNNTKVYFQNNFVGSIEAIPANLPFSINELKIEIQNILRKVDLNLDLFSTGSIDILSNRLYKAIEYGCDLSQRQNDIYSAFSNGKLKKFAVVTNGLSAPSERLFQQCLINKGIPIFSFEHGVTAGIDGIVAPHYFAKNLYTDGGDYMICYNDSSFKAMNNNRTESEGVVTGAPEVNKKIKYYKVQRLISRNYLKVNYNERVIFFLCTLAKNNLLVPPLHLNALKYYNLMKKMVFNVFALCKDQYVLKLYPSDHYLDPDPFYNLIKLPNNVKVIQYFEFSELRAAADVVLLSSVQSTFGWAWSARVPIILIELPTSPLMKNVVDLFDRALFRIDGSKESWQEEMLEILKMPHKKLLKLWEDKKDAREELETHIFGPKGNSGKRAADYIARKIIQ